MLFSIDAKSLEAYASSEARRWGLQFLVMLGAIPYVGIVKNLLALPLIFFGLFKFEVVEYTLVFIICLSYYLISLKLHLMFDKKRVFSGSPLISIRPYLTIPLVIQAMGAWGDFLYVPKEVQTAILKVFEPLEEASFILLFVSSVLLTWLLSEWICRVKRWRDRRQSGKSVTNPRKFTG